ncbi:hypothetical protein HK104_010186 [Borealophlyctis nickersoniae]|nr:hypothetical protein HK104_010186 [Borealophlyctis nickersoniae]
MRLFPALLGVLVAPSAYVTMRNLRFSNAFSILAAVLIIFENGLVCQSRLILLDSFLIFFTALTAMYYSSFTTYQEEYVIVLIVCRTLRPTMTVSVKWVGLFVIALIGLSTIQNLWKLLGDTRNSIMTLSKHFLARVLCLIIVPVAIYMILFQVHFTVLSRAGSGSGFMSPEFQSTLKGNEIADTLKDVAYGSKVYLRHHATNGGYLHSHKSTYPTGSKQQQITLYPFRDENSAFIILPPLQYVNETMIVTTVTEFQRVKHGDIVRLEHGPTGKRLHSHDHKAPVSDNDNHFEASGYGAPGFTGDTNDHWRVEILDYKPEKPHLEAIYTKFRLIHQNQGCSLFSHAVKLPEWGFGQQEVTCAKNGKKTLGTWLIEYNDHPSAPADAVKVNYKRPSFLKKFLEIHRRMWSINAGLTSSHPYDSRPSAWPILRRGISFWTSKKEGGQIYLIGNPLVWGAATVSILVYVIFEIISAILIKRGFTFTTTGSLARASQGGWFLFLGWALHYLPFFLMKRQLFLHHYFPALYFSVLLFCSMADVVTQRLRPTGQSLVALGIAVVAIWVFLEFSPLTYGLNMSKDHCLRIKWRSTWDWDCNRIKGAPQPQPVVQPGNDQQEEAPEDPAAST